MTTITLNCRGAVARARADGVITHGMVGIPVNLECDEAWLGLTRTLKARCGDVVRTVVAAEDRVILPYECLIAGQRLYIGLDGWDDAGALRLPSGWACCGMVQPSVADCDGEPGSMAIPPEDKVSAIYQRLDEMGQAVEALSQLEENAAEAMNTAVAAAERAEEVMASIPEDYSNLSSCVEQVKEEIAQVIVPEKSYQIIQGKAFNGFGKINDFEDAFLVLVEVPTDCAFLIVTKFNYQVAYGSGFRYSAPQYLDAENNRISACKVNAYSSTVDNTNEFGMITLCDVPEDAMYIAIPYANGTEFNIEYGYLDYAEKLSGCLIDGQLPYGIQLFEDGRNLVQNIFQNTIYSNATKSFNYISGSRCTAPILCSGGSRIYHDGVANTMYYFAFDSANGYISSGMINSGSTLPEIENVAYWIFQSVNDFSWISYSDLSLDGYKHPKKIRDDLLDLHITQKKLEYPYNGMVASFLGDSLTANGSGGDYITCLNDFFGFSSITNCGLGGTRMSGELSSFGDPMWMDSRINALDIDSDIIFVMGGTNDAPSGAPYLGDITPDNHDTSTFVGAYNVLLSKIYYRYCLVDGL